MTRSFLLASVLSALLLVPAEAQSSKETIAWCVDRHTGLTVDGVFMGQSPRTIVVTAGQEVDVTLGSVGPAEYDSLPRISSGALTFLGVEDVGPIVPGGSQQRFRFRAVKPGRAIITFARTQWRTATSVVDTIQVDRRQGHRFNSTPVPATAPDSVPKALWDSLTSLANLLQDPPGVTGSVIRDVIYVSFVHAATQRERQAAIDLVHGRVIGGMPLGVPEAFYAVRLPYVLGGCDSTSGPILRARAALSQLRTVSDVLLALMDRMKPLHVRQHELRSRAVVPAVPPDSVPADYDDSTRWVSGGDHMGGMILRDIIVLDFRRNTSQADKQAAIDLIQGVVIGGRRRLDGDGLYLIRVPTDGTIEPLFRAIGILRTLPQVSIAQPEMLMTFGPN